MNPGLKSRVSDVIEFPDFTAMEAAEMASLQLTEKRLTVPSIVESSSSTIASASPSATTGAAQYLEPWFARLIAAPHWANGRDVDNFVRRVAVECAKLKSTEVTPDALEAALITMLSQKDSGSISEPSVGPSSTSSPIFQSADPLTAAPPSIETERTVVVEKAGNNEDDDSDDDQDDDAAIASALEAALAALGYGTEANAARLVDILSAAVGGAPFPDSIRLAVCAATGASPEKVDAALRRQAKPVLSAVQSAITFTMKKREKQALNEADDSDDGKEADIQARLRTMGSCPMGFDWLRVENGWRCAGGSHFVPDNDPLLYLD